MCSKNQSELQMRTLVRGTRVLTQQEADRYKEVIEDCAQVNIFYKGFGEKQLVNSPSRRSWKVSDLWNLLNKIYRATSGFRFYYGYTSYNGQIA